jgi:N-methylhydantoinase A
VNGLIDPNYFLGGEIRLDLDLAKKGVSDIANKLGLSLNETADGILSVARNNMTTATMEILVGQGFDPRDFALMSYGGAGGIFASSIAKDMSISRVIIPIAPGVFSARGILAMNLVHTDAHAYIRAMDELNFEELEGIYGNMENRASKMLMAEGISKDDMEFERSLDLCYEGQRYYIETPVPSGRLKEQSKIMIEIKDSFERLYEIRYGHLIKAPLRTINARLKVTGKIKEIPQSEMKQGKKIPRVAIKRRRKVYLEGDFVESQIYERSGLLCGNIIDGPAIIEEPFHTTLVMPGQTLQVDKIGNLIITARNI